ncbi:hypothetical protein NDU88_002183 [Pleurodeles waltl]|uniref:Uncharacterized protein n=1 Tax=Pleurodeles waltl TaxID=8319 RepID=A0AAV7U933_PLEWA|nr:hypothetical protein NDU88_002183 [Pleurodeles waltl]
MAQCRSALPSPERPQKCPRFGCSRTRTSPSPVQAAVHVGSEVVSQRGLSPVSTPLRGRTASLPVRVRCRYLS